MLEEEGKLKAKNKRRKLKRTSKSSHSDPAGEYEEESKSDENQNARNEEPTAMKRKKLNVDNCSSSKTSLTSKTVQANSKNESQSGGIFKNLKKALISRTKSQAPIDRFSGTKNIQKLKFSSSGLSNQEEEAASNTGSHGRRSLVVPCRMGTGNSDSGRASARTGSTGRCSGTSSIKSSKKGLSEKTKLRSEFGQSSVSSYLAMKELGESKEKPASTTNKTVLKFTGIREYRVKDMITDNVEAEVISSRAEEETDDDVYHIIPLKEYDLESLLKGPTVSEVMKDKALDAVDAMIKERSADHILEMKAIDNRQSLERMRQKRRRMRFKENRLRLKLLQADLSKEQILKTFNRHCELLVEIKSGKVYSARHEAFLKGGNVRWSLNMTVYDGFFRDEDIEMILDEIDNKLGLKDVERMLNSDYNWKVLLPEMLIKVC